MYKLNRHKLPALVCLFAEDPLNQYYIDNQISVSVVKFRKSLYKVYSIFWVFGFEVTNIRLYFHKNDQAKASEEHLH